jgi:hypothetical protein
MSKASFERPVVFALRPNLLQRVSNAAEASYFLLHRWPQAKGPAYLAARNACYLAALGRMSADDCRRAFAGALAEAGMSNLDELSEAEGVGPTEARMYPTPWRSIHHRLVHHWRESPRGHKAIGACGLQSGAEGLGFGAPGPGADTAPVEGSETIALDRLERDRPITKKTRKLTSHGLKHDSGTAFVVDGK